MPETDSSVARAQVSVDDVEQRLLELRLNLCLTQAKLASDAGVSVDTIRRLERSRCLSLRHDAARPALARVAAALNQAIRK